MQMNEQCTLFFWNVLLLHERHHNSCYRASVALLEVTRMFSSKTPEDSLKVLACFPYIPLPWCTSKAVVTLLNDIRIVCSPFSMEKALHMHRRAALIHLHTCWHPCQLFSTDMHEPWHCFCILNSEPVTLSPRYFGVPSYQSLKFIKIQYVRLLNKNRCNVNKQDGDSLSSNKIRV